MRKASFSLHFVDKLWYGHHPLRWLLLPFTMLYCLFVTIRRAYLRCFCQKKYAVPIIVVGNLTVGGVGKTPLVISLAKQLQARGLRVGIVSRGYGAKIRHFPCEVNKDASALEVGDEPLLLARKTNCPVVIAPKRTDAVQYLLDNYQSQIIISDDGLQHYAMGRAIEIIVVDGIRGLGNGFCLPAGPLRENPKRLQQADFIIVNGQVAASFDDLNLTSYRMDLVPGALTQLISGQSSDVNELEAPIAAVAAIGHPQRFFSTLKTFNIKFKEYIFADHHHFCADDLRVAEKIIVMTEKDAVKCQSFATEKMYFLPVEARVDDKFWNALWSHEQLQGHV